ncbi:MAG: hypothetical protein HFH53_09540 [Hespellia sp.]|nr:hypothetical protein [Hespellia sp.]
MNKDNYAETFLNAYHNGVFEIIWNTSGFSLGVDPRKKELIPELKEKKFIDYAFSIIKIVMDLAENKEVENILEDDLEVARIVYSQEKDLKNHLYVKKNSKINCFKLLEGQIISYRNEEDPGKIDANSAIIKMVMEKNDEDVSCTFEVSGRDLENIINDLIELKEKMDSI